MPEAATQHSSRTVLIVRRPSRASACSKLRQLSHESQGRDDAYMVRIRTLAQEALSWTFLEANQRLMWASVLEFDAVPIQEKGYVTPGGCRACEALAAWRARVALIPVTVVYMPAISCNRLLDQLFQVVPVQC